MRESKVSMRNLPCNDLFNGDTCVPSIASCVVWSGLMRIWWDNTHVIERKDSADGSFMLYWRGSTPRCDGYTVIAWWWWWGWSMYDVTRPLSSMNIRRRHRHRHINSHIVQLWLQHTEDQISKWRLPSVLVVVVVVVATASSSTHPSNAIASRSSATASPRSHSTSTDRWWYRRGKGAMQFNWPCSQ